MFSFVRIVRTRTWSKRWENKGGFCYTIGLRRYSSRCGITSLKILHPKHSKVFLIPTKYFLILTKYLIKSSITPIHRGLSLCRPNESHFRRKNSGYKFDIFRSYIVVIRVEICRYFMLQTTLSIIYVIPSPLLAYNTCIILHFSVKYIW